MECDVIVVGAGVSGLAAADQLGSELHVIVLEASRRVGGRLRSVDGLDLGASWFWPGEHRVATLVDELKIPTHPQHLPGDALYDTSDGVVRLDGNPIDVTSSRFSNGADDLTDALHRRFAQRTGSALLLDSHVHTVEWSEARDRPLVVTATVAGVAREVSADHVVIAVPPALAASTIEFKPSLPDEIADLAMRTPVWMGTTTKTVARYSSPFWRDDGLSGSAVSQLGPLHEIHDLSGPGGQPAALFGFAPTTARSGAVDETAVLAQLVRLFGPPAADPLDLHLADWRREPLTTPVGVADLTDYSTYGDPRFHRPSFGGRLHWSSTETSAVAPGHIEGALAAAERTVETIRATDVPPHHQETP
jgi:monoamine oxidase